MERAEGKIIITFLLLVLIFIFMYDYLLQLSLLVCYLYVAYIHYWSMWKGFDLQGVEYRARKQLRDMFHDIRKNNASTHWLTNDILQALRAYWDSS